MQSNYWMVQKYHLEDRGYRDAYWETLNVTWDSLEKAQRYAREITRIGHDARIMRVEVVEEYERQAPNNRRPAS